MKSRTMILLAGATPAAILGCIAMTPTMAAMDTGTLYTPDSSGTLATITTNGRIDTNNPFFKSLGTNGRACVTCHQPAEAWSVTPAGLMARFNATHGMDPAFRLNDGANSPLADVSTEGARRSAYSMLLNKGLIRVGIGIPANAEFALAAVEDPYGYASASELSLFRRPLPSTNLRFVTGVMWDGRETHGAFAVGDPSTAHQTLVDSLSSQAIDATNGHAQASVPPSATQVQQIVDFELGLSTAQASDNAAGWLNELGAAGGAEFLESANFYVGINDTLGADPNHQPFDPTAMTLFTAWDHPRRNGRNRDGRTEEAQAAIARGQRLFNLKSFDITGVGGLNDALSAPVIRGTCTTCHNAPNVGSHSVTLPLNIGLTDASRRTRDMPLYTLRNTRVGDPDFGETLRTTDPGRALITGKWRDIGKFKGPVLRGLAGRAPYFHNGLARDLEMAVEFYDSRFHIGLTPQERADLAAFLRSL